jgi:YVTN family beta-propeller protein
LAETSPPGGVNPQRGKARVKGDNIVGHISKELHTVSQRSLIAFIASLFLAFTLACNTPPKTSTETPTPVSTYRVYVTNESSGDLSVIDPGSHKVVATVPLGKRPRGIRDNNDGSEIYVALSGSPSAPPGVDESTLPPPDRTADGIGVVDVQQLKKTRILHSGIDPENFDISKDGKFLYVSNEDGAALSVVNIATGDVDKSIKGGEEP